VAGASLLGLIARQGVAQLFQVVNGVLNDVQDFAQVADCDGGGGAFSFDRRIGLITRHAFPLQ
jgi:hypothetical protein